jgi:hypothetical protein
MGKLIPYSVYLPPDYYEKIKELAKKRKASCGRKGCYQDDY